MGALTVTLRFFEHDCEVDDMTIRKYARLGGVALLAAAGWLLLMPWTADGQDRSRARSNSKKEATTERSRSAKQGRATSSRAAQRSAASRQGPQRRAGQRAASQRSGQRNPQRAHRPVRRSANRGTVGGASRRPAVSARGRTQRVRPQPAKDRQSRPSVPVHRPAKRPVQRRPKPYRPTGYDPIHRRGGVSIDVDIDIAWPWPKRHRRAWRPRYRYRQIVNVNATWARRRHSARIDVRTQYHHRVLRAGPRRAEVVITIDAIELYAGGRYLGVVDRIPRPLRRVKATIYRDGPTRFDRNLFVIGTPRLGFELIATRSYDRPLLGAYHRGDGLNVGRLDFYAGEVVPVRRSRLFRPHAFNGLAPISLLPDRAAWRFDVGIGALSAYPYRGDDYYDGYEGGGDWDDREYERYEYDRDDFDDERYFGPSSDSEGRPTLRGLDPLRRSYDDTVRLPNGGQVTMAREVHLERIQ